MLQTDPFFHMHPVVSSHADSCMSPRQLSFLLLLWGWKELCFWCSKRWKILLEKLNSNMSCRSDVLASLNNSPTSLRTVFKRSCRGKSVAPPQLLYLHLSNLRFRRESSEWAERSCGAERAVLAADLSWRTHSRVLVLLTVCSIFTFYLTKTALWQDTITRVSCVKTHQQPFHRCVEKMGVFSSENV